jgi:predicted nicotinamide N-methyase
MVGFSLAWKSSIESVSIFILTKYIIFPISYLLDNKSLVRGRHVLDVGSGCGASAIAAKMAGAIHVIANDIDQGEKIFYPAILRNSFYHFLLDALIATCHNARHNSVIIDKCSSDNLLQNPSLAFDKNIIDLLIIGDMCYDEQLAQKVLNLIAVARQYHIHVLLADPGRYSFKSIVANQLNDKMKRVCEYPIVDRDYIESDFETIQIWST